MFHCTGAAVERLDRDRTEVKNALEARAHARTSGSRPPLRWRIESGDRPDPSSATNAAAIAAGFVRG